MISSEEARELMAEPIELELGLLTGKSARHFVTEAPFVPSGGGAFLFGFPVAGGNRGIGPSTPSCLAGWFGYCGCGH